jgi:hypothetical protein
MVICLLLYATNYVELTDALPNFDSEGHRLSPRGRMEFRIHIKAASSSLRLPSSTGTLMAVGGTAVPMRYSAVTFYPRKLDDGRWIAVDWHGTPRDWQGRYSASDDHRPPRCKR